MAQRTIAKVKYQEGFYIVFKTDFNPDYLGFPNEKNDIQLLLEDEQEECLCDAVCFFGSFGVKENLMEVMSSFCKDTVEGYLTFQDVLKYFNRHIRKYKKEKEKKQ